MYQIRPERGEKRACLTCEAKFYDLGRAPVLCPKCGAEFVETVRPAAAVYRRAKSPFGRGYTRPIEDTQESPRFTDDTPRSDDEKKEDDQEEERESDDGEEESEE